MITRWTWWRLLDRAERHLFLFAFALYLVGIICSIVIHDWSDALRMVPLTIVTLWVTVHRNRGNDQAFYDGWFAGIARYDAALEGHVDEVARAHLLVANRDAPTRQQYAEQNRRMEDELAQLERPSVEDLLAVLRKYNR